jgi:hypothetical protein
MKQLDTRPHSPPTLAPVSGVTGNTHSPRPLYIKGRGGGCVRRPGANGTQAKKRGPCVQERLQRLLAIPGVKRGIDLEGAKHD